MTPLISMLVSETGLSEKDVSSVIRSAPHRYKTYPIQKRHGGERLISQPAREVKAFQRLFVAKVLQNLPVHSSATAYRKGSSIKENAAAHAGDGPILKYDFEDFFPSILARDWRTYCEISGLFQATEDIAHSIQILFHQRRGSTVLRLAIGAPSSPILSNILMYDFDGAISAAVGKDRVAYTRYADDLTFSAERTGFLTGVDHALRVLLRDMKSPRLKIKEEKTVLATRKYRRQVTGLILTNDGQVSIGHERKRALRAALHHAQMDKLSFAELLKLSGMLAFVRDVEPALYSRLIARHDPALIEKIITVSKTA